MKVKKKFAIDIVLFNARSKVANIVMGNQRVLLLLDSCRSRDSSENGGRRQREAVSRDINKAKFKGAEAASQTGR